jgi:hypothetical protein
LLIDELVVPTGDATGLDALVAGGDRAFVTGESVFAAGAYRAEVVSALDPAAVEPDDANDEEAPTPVALADAFDWM